MLAISEERLKSPDRPGIRAERLFADREMEVVADEGVTDDCEVSGIYSLQ